MDRVIIFDTTLRDGEQSPGASLNSDEKLEIAQQLARLGVDVIEAGFPIASPDDFEAVRRIAREVKGPIIAGLARAKPEDIDRCWEAVREAERPRIHTFLSTSDIHLSHQFRMSRERALEEAVAMVRRAKSYCEDVEFSPMDATRSDREYLYRVLEAVIEAGATTLNIADTVGYITPDEMYSLIKGMFERVRGIEKVVVSVHCHNDLGMAVANSLAGVRAGARQVECTINGIGERAGNTSLEEIVMALNTRADVYGLTTNIDTTQILKTSRLVSSLTGIPVQPNKAVVGSNAFAHESGIHQDGVLKERSTYEIMRAEQVGYASNNLVLGKHSGRHALRVRLQELGYQLTPEELNRAFVRFKELADKKKEVSDRDLEAIMADELRQTTETYHLDLVQVLCGEPAIPTATVQIRTAEGQVRTATATGTGPVDAVYRAIDQIVGLPNRLEVYNVHSVTSGMDALAEVSLRIEVDGRTYHGRGANTDIVVASAGAYMSALNRAAATIAAGHGRPALAEATV
ncbi:MAG: 2-isopropylmalate synthase [Chloroflexi bacterium]|nr:2-isopropylmalate synthase [Chloroflexota bacterium]